MVSMFRAQINWPTRGRSFSNLAHLWRCIALSLGIAVSGMVWAGYVPSYTVVEERHDLTIRADMSHDHKLSRVIRIDTPSGVDEWGEVSQSYNADLSSMDVEYAYVMQPDGQRNDVQPENIKVRDAYVDEDSPIFSNEKEVFVIFPRVQVGSVLHFSFRKTQQTPYFPGRFSWLDYQLPYVPVVASEVEVTYASAVNLRFATRGAYLERPLTRSADVPDGYLRRSYEFRQQQVVPYESGGVSYSDTAPMLMVSNFSDYADVGAAYDKRAYPRTRPDAAVTALAKSLVEGIPGTRERVQKLHAWVAQNIRYVGTYVGAGGFVPNPAPLILERHYGDCKDHAALLEAMLAAVGIESSPVLINLGRAYQLMPLPSTWPFNHVITYVPELDLFVDSTSRYARTGTLPLGDLGKPVVITRTGEIKRTPGPSPVSDTETVVTHWVMLPNGDMQGTTRFEKTGWSEVGSRAYHLDNAEIDQDKDSRRYLKDQQELGSGQTHAPKSDDWSVPWVVTTSTLLAGVANLPEPSAFAIPIGMAPGTLMEFANAAPNSMRQRPWRCASRRVKEVSTIELPSQAKIQYLPRDVTIDAKQWSYQSTYSQTGTQLRIERELVLRFEKPWCEASLASKWSQFIAILRRDVRGQIFLIRE